MRLLRDESAEMRLARFLRQQGHDVTTVVHQHAQSLVDSEVLRIAHAEARILITNDRDFGELVFRLGLPHQGVIYFRLPLDTTADQKIDWLRRILSERSDALGRFIVVTPQGLRMT